jgi:hypothetical protein
MGMVESEVSRRLLTCADWAQHIPAEEWAIYKSVMEEAGRRGVPFAIGGALATTTYAGTWRDTKDLDLWVIPEDREAMTGVVTDCGLKDYYEVLAYDRAWIYRSHRDQVIVDVIWAMANQRATADRSWLQGPEIEADGLRVRLLPPEHVLWSELYILQRDRCDWPAALAIVQAIGTKLDWQRLVELLGEDKALLRGLLAIFEWLSPERARELPQWLFTYDRDGEQAAGGEVIARRARLLDTRPWLPAAFPEMENRISAKGTGCSLER